jgi:hypothetical protein
MLTQLFLTEKSCLQVPVIISMLAIRPCHVGLLFAIPTKNVEKVPR